MASEQKTLADPKSTDQKFAKWSTTIELPDHDWDKLVDARLKAKRMDYPDIKTHFFSGAPTVLAKVMYLQTKRDITSIYCAKLATHDFISHVVATRLGNMGYKFNPVYKGTTIPEAMYHAASVIELTLDELNLT